MTWILTSVAQVDALEIWDFVFQASGQRRADALLADLERAFDRAASAPLAGIERPELAPSGVRFVLAHAYMVASRADRTPIEILRIMHASRDVRGVEIDPGGV